MGILDEFVGSTERGIGGAVQGKIVDEVSKKLHGEAQSPNEPRCPKCKAPITDSSLKFCPKCGTNLALTCPKCGKPVMLGAKFCTNCGAPIPQKK